MSKEVSNGTEIFVPQTNGCISDSLIKNWTLQALECYSINCDCTKCSINKTKYSFVCQMPKVIKELIRQNIKPDVSLFDNGNYAV